MANKNDQLVVGLYEDETSATGAVDILKDWDDANDDVKLGAIAVITYDSEKDKLKYDEVGQRSTKAGAGWGTAIGATLAVLSGGITLIPGMIAGAAAGGALGALNHKSLGMTDEQKEEINATLKKGGVGLGVMADDFEVDAVVAKLAETGANVEHYKLDADAAAAITEAASQASSEEASDEAADDDGEGVAS